MTVKVTKDSESEIAFVLRGPHSRSVVGAGDGVGVEWVTSLTGIDVKVHAPGASLPSSWTSVDIGFPIETASTSDAASEGDDYLVASGATISIGDTIAIIADTYFGDNGQAIMARVVDNGEGTNLQLASPLPVGVPVGAAVYNITARHTLTASNCASLGDGAIHVRMTAGDRSWQWIVPFRVVRRIPVWSLDADRLMQLAPIVIGLREPTDATFQETINAARDVILLPSLMSRGIREENIVATHDLEAVHALACVFHLKRNNRSEPQENIDAANADYVQALDMALSSRDAWYLTEQDTEAPQQPVGESSSLSGIRWTR